MERGVKVDIRPAEWAEIDDAAKDCGMTVARYIAQATLWVMYNCAEVPGMNPLSVDKLACNDI